MDESSPPTVRTDVPTSNIGPHQTVTLFPSYVFCDPADQQWKTPMNGFVHTTGRERMGQRVFLRVLKQVLDVTDEELQSNDVFQRRIPDFLHEPQRGKSIAVSLFDDQLRMTGKSRRSGHIAFSVTLPEHRTSRDWLTKSPHGLPRIPFSVSLPSGDHRRMEASAGVIPPRGVSVISDIDDTLKISQVAHRKQLLHNTFLYPFVAVPGMAPLFSQWHSQGVSFHYVSSSPWQLFSPLKEFMHENGFPVGSFHLRTYQFSDPSVLKLFMSRKRNKYKIIGSILSQFPERQFVLIGDSGEKDPEIYGKVARRFPGQISRILIRIVDGRPWTRKRVAKAFRAVPEDRWQTFRVPTQIRELSLPSYAS